MIQYAKEKLGILVQGTKDAGSITTNNRIDLNYHLSKLQFQPIPMQYYFKESAKFVHRTDINQGNRADVEKIHEVIFEILPHNLDILEELLWNVSNSNHSAYGNHRTINEIADITMNNQSVNHLVVYLQHMGVNDIEFKTMFHEYIGATAPIGLWEEIFQTIFYEFHYKVNGIIQTIVRALEYSLPNCLIDHVSAVFNTVQLPPRSTRRRLIKRNSSVTSFKNLSTLSKVANAVVIQGATPLIINQAYSITNNSGNMLGSQAIYATNNQMYSPKDLQIFRSSFHLPNFSILHDYDGHVSNTACSTNSGNDCDEANLDTQCLTAVSYVTPTTFFYDNTTNWLSWILQTSNLLHPPLVISISYGSLEQDLTSSEVNAFNIFAQKLGLHGVTLVTAAGDDGAVGSGIRGQSTSNCGYNPEFPASSPYVVSVGGTRGPESGTTEVACQSDKGGIITSGGGFSLYSTIPNWQVATVTKYFNTAAGSSNAPTSGYATNGRGYPDVSAMAYDYPVILSGKFNNLYGTSASCPVVAGMMSLVNAKRLEVRKSTLGWINPTLYQYSSAFVNDITSGNNKCAALGSPCCSQGYTAVSGWDPISGLGSINFTRFLDTMLSIANKPNYPTYAPISIPTVSPTSLAGAPTFTPTTMPSFAPTASAMNASFHYLYLNIFANSDCTGEIVQINAVPTYKCIPRYDRTYTSVQYYIKYSCSQVGATKSLYSDSSCHNIISSSSYEFTCNSDLENFYYFNPEYPSYLGMQLGCSTTTSYLNLIPLTGYQYTINRTYAETTSCTTEAEVDIYLQNYCFNTYSTALGTQFKSYSITGTKISFFLQPLCDYPTCSYYSIPANTCLYFPPVSSWTTYVSNTYSPSVNPTPVPTTSPSVVPTPIQTFAPSPNPSSSPTTFAPTQYPSNAPTYLPTANPSTAPSNLPSIQITCTPTTSPSSLPSTLSPTAKSSSKPSELPSIIPTHSPSVVKTSQPSPTPTRTPSVSTTILPSQSPTISLQSLNLTFIVTISLTNLTFINSSLSKPLDSTSKEVILLTIADILDTWKGYLTYTQSILKPSAVSDSFTSTGFLQHPQAAIHDEICCNNQVLDIYVQVSIPIHNDSSTYSTHYYTQLQKQFNASVLLSDNFTQQLRMDSQQYNVKQTLYSKSVFGTIRLIPSNDVQTVSITPTLQPTSSPPSSTSSSSNYIIDSNITISLLYLLIAIILFVVITFIVIFLIYKRFQTIQPKIMPTSSNDTQTFEFQINFNHTESNDNNEIVPFESYHYL